MKARNVRLGLVLTTFVLLASAPPALAAAADTTTVVQREVDVNPGETNPCTGAIGTIVDDEQDVFHITVLGDGTLRLSGHSTAAVTFVPDDPNGVRYEGHETFTISENGTRNAFATTITTSVRVRGTDGSFLTFREIAHLTITAAGVVTAFDRPALVCP
jgi:hypothetical protein